MSIDRIILSIHTSVQSIQGMQHNYRKLLANLFVRGCVYEAVIDRMLATDISNTLKDRSEDAKFGYIDAPDIDELTEKHINQYLLPSEIAVRKDLYARWYWGILGNRILE